MSSSFRRELPQPRHRGGVLAELTGGHVLLAHVFEIDGLAAARSGLGRLGEGVLDKSKRQGRTSPYS